MKAQEAAQRASVFIENADYDGMLQLLLQEPNNVDVLYYAGIAYEAMNNAENAIKCWRKALNLHEQPNVIRALANHWSKSVETLDHAAAMLELLEENDDAECADMTMLAEIYMRQGKLEEAHYAFVTANELDPDNCDTLTSHALLHIRWALRLMNEAKKYDGVKLDILTDEPELRSLFLAIAEFNTEETTPTTADLATL